MTTDTQLAPTDAEIDALWALLSSAAIASPTKFAREVLDKWGQPAAVAGCTRSHPHENMDSACRAKAAIAEMRDKAARGAEATAQDLERFVRMLAAQAVPAAVAGPDDYTPLLDDEGRVMVGTSHHYTAENIRALVAEYKALEAGGPDTWELHYNTDHRARAGVLWRVISALADEVPFAAAPTTQPSPAAQGDALDAARYRWLCGKFGETRLPCALEKMLEHGYIADGKPSIDAAIDAARAAQEDK